LVAGRHFFKALENPRRLEMTTGYRKRQQHRFSGCAIACLECGQSMEDHRIPCEDVKRAGSIKAWRAAHPEAVKEYKNKYAQAHRKEKNEAAKLYRAREQMFIGIDGEGVGRDYHRYILLSACGENGQTWDLEKPESRLLTRECFDFIWSLPKNAKIFAYAFNYDLTMMLQDMPDNLLYLLFRPDLRRRPPGVNGLDPIKWEGYNIDLQSTRFSIEKQGRKVVIWDVFKFYQSKFVTALENWKVGSQELWERMSEMKGKRSEFTIEQFDEIKTYCHEECLCMAQLVRKLVNAHKQAGLYLTSFYGAGSCGAAILKKMGVREYSGKQNPEMSQSISAAFFGGRFENSKIGLVDKPVYNWDISSAYPYQLTFLPCLEHCTWELVRDESKVDRYSLVNFKVPTEVIHANNAPEPWGCLPLRHEDGTICFPSSMRSGWVYGQEYLAAKKYWPRIQFRQAWILHRNCDHQPFKDIPHYYRERIKLGKEGAGIVLKLGPNSVYGKLAQSVGKGQFQNWIWAGMVTSGCRAQLLTLLGMHENRSNALMVATDGLFTTEQLVPPSPLDTGTFETGKPLGGWECKTHERGIFCVRPGIYFPPNPTEEEIKYVKGRGLGKRTILENWERIVDSWNNYGISRSIKVGEVTIFCGAKTSISRSGNSLSYNYTRAESKNESAPSYGQWITRVAELSLDPWPKRCSKPNPDGTLLTRNCEKKTSFVYSKADMSLDSRLCLETEDIRNEQPDGMF